ncbi:GntR family transcriptional regulator [Wenzhouxiangella sp. XN79A]|uniref:GntR family transcriptional regulator n=1 Tax=Wenzhouxiangella sp. XN79A TaxID=2724193 RepID=UPI00144AC323|nr:GntR family transcriptional regulator [Wenzhouxiangella sp. XN79A]NKI35187.1 GntR family transcriptional regulator [Wenzhouxiangella sp. XN79A]
MSDVQKAAPRLEIDLQSDVPVVHQITRGLRRCLLDGALAPGDLLPSSRALARDLGVHFNTVAQAYRELEAEGWLALKRRAGSVVLDRRRPRLSNAEQARLGDEYESALRDLRADYEARGLARAALDQRTRRVLDPEGDAS